MRLIVPRGPHACAAMVRYCFSAVLVLLLTCAPAAWARSITVSRWADSVHVSADGSARVSEQITYVFTGSYHGIYREIPIEYPGPKGTNYTLFIKVEQISDESGAPLHFEKSVSNGFLKLKVTVPGAIDASRTVTIEYSVANAVKFFDDHEEFYWNVTGNDSPLPIQSAAATVYFPENTSGLLKAQAFAGTYGSTQLAPCSVEGATASCETERPLPMHGGLTIDVYIPKGLLHEPGALSRAIRFLRSNPILTLPVWAFAVMFALWWFKGRDPDAGRSVAPMYEPPAGIRPAEAGTLVDDRVNPRDITAVLVDLAVRGYIKIVEAPHKGLLFTTKDYELHLLKNRDQWTDLSDYERAMLDKIFAGGSMLGDTGTSTSVAQMTRVSELRNHFYTVLPVMKSEIMGGLKSKGMYSVDPDSASGLAVLGALAVAIPYVAAQVLKWADFTDSMGATILAIIIAVIIIFIFGRLLSAKTLKGAQTRVQILGFEEFMNRVDSDRLKRMPPDTFEKYLPYAMALGVEHRWAKAFEGILQNPPTWYQGDWTTFNTFYFVNSLGAMTQQTSQAFVSAPRSSSSSSGWSGGGFSGGGFSGGGFGGGGTGGW
ncbi:MAG TPA: DUF2207 domain-containing protein [Candidatus Angelobacter sp.]|nr:DUF2207 domain-containing protein [Candidatus Angelobacter sp.]